VSLPGGLRLFVAIELPHDVLAALEATQGQLRAQGLGGLRWVRPEGIHLTLKFLGDIEETKVEPIAHALERALCPFPRFTINVKSLGVFPDGKRPRILWVGLEGNRLSALALAVEKALEPLGFSPEGRGFLPHLTVGRWQRFEAPAKAFAEELKPWQSHEFGESNVTEVIFFRSELKPEGAFYHPLKVVALS
jgi:2'-5' RNA ligase